MSGDSTLSTPSLPVGESIAHHFGGKVYIKETRINAGQILVQHKHAYDHLSYLVSGRASLEVDGGKRLIQGPAAMTIEAGKHHGVTALTDCVWLCIHSTDCTDEDHVDEVLMVAADPSVIAAMLGAAQ